MVKCPITGKSVRFYHKKRYIYPGKSKGGLDITDAQILSEEGFNKEYHISGEEKAKQAGIQLFVQKKFKEALKQLESVFNPKDATDWYSKGNLLINLKRDNEALKCFDEALFLDTHYIKAWYRKGTILFFKRKYENAGRCFENVMKLEEKKKKRAGYARADWWMAAQFLCMLSWISLCNELAMKKKLTQELYDYAKKYVNNCRLLFANAIAVSKDEAGRYGYVMIAQPGMNETEFIDYCQLNRNKILDLLEPPVIVELYSAGQKH
jgi:tetratricopeptide (TPR) repeat protein